MPPPTLLLDTYIFTKPAGGMAKATAYLYAALLRQFGDALTVRGLSQKAPLPDSLPAGIENQRLPLPLGRESWRNLAFPLASHALRPQWIHFPANGLLPKLPIRRGCKTIVTLHDLLQLDMDDFYAPHEAHKREAYRQRLQHDIAHADCLITISPYSERRILYHFRDLKRAPVVIPNAPTLQKPPGLAAPMMDLSALPQRYFLYTGRYEKRKGLEWLLDAVLAASQQGGLNAQVLITGAPAYHSEAFREKMNTATALGLVRELGYVSEAELARLMHGALALVYPSSAEGFGLPPLEAMALGCPVITTPLTALADTCGEAAYYVHPQAPESLLTALKRLATEAPLRRELITLGTRRVAQFSWARSATLFHEQLMQRANA